MNKIKTLQWEVQTTNLRKQDCINITSNNHYTLFSWSWDSKIKEYLISYFCSLFLSLFFLMPPFCCHPPIFYRHSPFLIPSVGYFSLFYWFPLHSYPETGLLGGICNVQVVLYIYIYIYIYLM